jgi:cobalamin biosynthesis protein CobT
LKVKDLANFRKWLPKEFHSLYPDPPVAADVKEGDEEEEDEEGEEPETEEEEPQEDEDEEEKEQQEADAAAEGGDQLERDVVEVIDDDDIVMRDA